MLNTAKIFGRKILGLKNDGWKEAV